MNEYVPDHISYVVPITQVQMASQMMDVHLMANTSPTLSFWWIMYNN